MTDSRDNFLDCLRALAITLVVLAHFHHHIFPGASIGVAIFFPLSGYLVTKSFLQDPHVGRFYIRRFMRVWPPYVVALFINYGLLIKFGDPRADIFHAHFLGMLSFTGVADEWLGFGIGVMWTLYVEFWFYILVPLVFIAARTTKLRLIALAVLSLASTIFLFVFLNAPNMPKLVTYFMPIYALTWMTPLLFGAIVAIKPPGRIPFMRTTWLCLGALILITLFVSNDERQIVWPVEAIAAAAIASVWIAAWHANDVKVPASPISFIGKISYSIYLLHGIALDWMDKIPWPFGTASPLEWSKTWAIIAVVLVASTGMYYAIEAPAQRIGKQLAKLIRIKGSPQGPLALQAR